MPAFKFPTKIFLYKFTVYDIFSNFVTGDDGQLQPFTVVARKMQLMPSIFDLAISKPMKHFTIHGQSRSNDNYQAFLGNFLHILLNYIVYNVVIVQTLEHITLAFDIRMLSPAVGYVALSRVSSFDNVVPLLRLRKSHFIISVK